MNFDVHTEMNHRRNCVSNEIDFEAEKNQFTYSLENGFQTGHGFFRL